MNLIYTQIKWIMLIAGLLTCSMIFAFFAPQAALINMFGEALNEPLAQVIVRSWGFLIFLMGALLIYGAYKPIYRNLVLAIVGISKLAFVALNIVFGAEYIDKTAIALMFDSALVVIFLAYLLKARGLASKAV